MKLNVFNRGSDNYIYNYKQGIPFHHKEWACAICKKMHKTGDNHINQSKDANIYIFIHFSFLDFYGES